MEIQIGIKPNCSEWDQELFEEDYELPIAVKEAIEEAKSQIKSEWEQ